MTDIAIIGHGPSVHGKKLGRLIDSCDIVIRMHTCDWQPPVDYGTKYDFGILPGPWLERAIGEIKRLPYRGWFVYFLHNQKRKKEAPKKIYNLPVYAEEKLFADLFPDIIPTRGLCAIAAAASLEPDNIYLAGFDSIICGKVVQYHPEFDSRQSRTPEEYVGKAANARHNFSVERRKLGLISEIYNTNIVDISCTK